MILIQSIDSVFVFCLFGLFCSVFLLMNFTMYTLFLPNRFICLMHFVDGLFYRD